MSSRNEREVLCGGVKYMDADNVIILLEWLRGQKYLINEYEGAEV